MATRTHLLTLVGLGAAVLVAAAGCGSADASAVNPLARPATATPTLTQDQFVRLVETESYASKGTPDGFVDLAHSTCQAFEHGASWVQVISVLVKQGDYTGYEAGNFVGLAVSTFCPEERGKLPAS